MKSRTALTTGIALAAALATTLATVPVTSAQASPASATVQHRGVKVTNKCLTSVPDPGTTEKVKICYSLFRPAGATKHHRVPMIMHSHGWGGSRTTDPTAFAKFLKAGYGVVSFDQRGFGESGGQAYVENPEVEGHDVRKLVRLISKLGWVKQDGKGDPRLGAIGGSYGGGYQFLGAFEELRVKGKPVFDALAPEITWFDLHESLAPENVVRTAWASALTAAAEPTDALPQQVVTAFAEGAATGTWPDGSSPTGTNLNPFFAKNGPKWHVDHGRRLDIPVLFGQGTTDSLFPLEQGLQNWKKSITRRSRAHSIFVAYNGGHVLPAVTPPGIDVTSDPCSKKLGGGTFEDLSLRFFNEQIKHRDTGLHGYGRYHLATPDSTCTTVDSVRPTKAFKVGTVATTETGGAPLSYEITKGPIRIAGSSYLTGKLTALGADNRAFYGLAVGTSPADAHLVQNNVLPLNEAAPVNGEKRRIALPSVAINVPAGQSLYILATAVSDTFVGMGSRTPGAVIFQNTVLHLPVVGG
jgi:ABC-2 type transport system ATP-binding protein